MAQTSSAPGSPSMLAAASAPAGDVDLPQQAARRGVLDAHNGSRLGKRRHFVLAVGVEVGDGDMVTETAYVTPIDAQGNAVEDIASGWAAGEDDLELRIGVRLPRATSLQPKPFRTCALPVRRS